MTEEECWALLESVLWAGQPVCPYCSSLKVTGCLEPYRHHCNGCNKSFRATVGTPFHNTRISLDVWFDLFWRIINRERLSSVREMAVSIGVNKETYRRMLDKLRLGIVYESSLMSDIEMAIRKERYRRYGKV